MSNGIILYEGPSLIDGAPIVVIATGVAKRSTNEKTGALIQTWILRQDVSPVDATHTGDDASICGDCPHRGTIENGRNVGRSCYVTVFQAPLVVWKAYKRGLYQHGSIPHGYTVRLGSYGDPAAVPYEIWGSALQGSIGHTGYTHQWRTCDERLQNLCMASADTAIDRLLATAAGWRTFRVRHAFEPVEHREVVCPASAEAGFKTTCASCRACGGLSSKARADIVIAAHGAASKVNAFNGRVAA